MQKYLIQLELESVQDQESWETVCPDILRVFTFFPLHLSFLCQFLVLFLSHFDLGNCSQRLSNSVEESLSSSPSPSILVFFFFFFLTWLHGYPNTQSPRFPWRKRGFTMSKSLHSQFCIGSADYNVTSASTALHFLLTPSVLHLWTCFTCETQARLLLLWVHSSFN